MGKSPTTNGLIMGAVLSIGALAMATISPRSFILYGRFVLLPAAVYFMYRIGTDQKERNEGVLNFSEAFQAIFIGSLIAYTILNISEYILFNFINPELNVITQEVMLDLTHKSLDWVSGFMDTDLDAMERAKAEIANEFTVDKVARTPINAMITLMGNMVSPCIIFGLIVAAFTKSKNA